MIRQVLRNVFFLQDKGAGIERGASGQFCEVTCVNRKRYDTTAVE